MAKETLQTAEEIERLETLSRYQILDSPPEPVFDDLTALAAEVFETPMSMLSFLDKEREWFKSQVGLSRIEIPREQSFSTYTNHPEDVLVIPDATRDERFSRHPLVTGEPRIRFYAGCALVSASGQRLGTFSVLDIVPHELTSHQRRMLRILSHEAVLLLELRRETHENRRANEEKSRELQKLAAGIKADAREHCRIETTLKKREQQLADAQSMTHLGSWEWDIAENTVAWSEELYRIFGREPNEFAATYQAYLDYVHPDDRPNADRTVKKALREIGAFKSEHRIIRSDGAVRILSSRGEVFCDATGLPRRMVGSCLDVTESRHMEQNLETSLALLKATLESTADGILVVDLKGQLMCHNQKFVDMWQLPAASLQNYDDQQVLERILSQLKDPQEFLARVRSLYENLGEDGVDVLKFKDGRTFDRYSQPLRVGDKITGRVWGFRDVTDRCQALEIVRHSEQRYRSLVIATTEVVWTSNAEGDLIEESPSWGEFTGQTLQGMSGRGWANVIHLQDRERVKEMWAHAVSTRNIFQAEFKIRRHDQAWRHMYARGVPVIELDGTVREWVGFCIDQTERKEAEQRIIEERDFSQALINSLPGIFYVLDETGLNLRWNNNLETVTGYSCAEIATMNAIDFVPPEERSLLRERVHKVFSAGRADVEITLLGKNGSLTPYYCTGQLVNLRGRPHLVGTGIDISKRKHAEDEIKRLNVDLEKRVLERTSQLRASNKELEAFTYTASHDLRAPIRAMVGFAGAIQEDCAASLDEESRLYLERIIQAGDRMLQLVDDLLSYSRIGRTGVQFGPINLRELLGQLAGQFALQLKAIGGKIAISEDLPIVIGDRTLLTQIFSNLLENAIHYRREEVPLKVTVGWRRKGENAIVFISDNGIGIEPEYHQKIFEIFERLHRENKYGSTGIGLATVKKAAETLGGNVQVKSAVGKGSTFFLRLRLTPWPSSLAG